MSVEFWIVAAVLAWIALAALAGIAIGKFIRRGRGRS